MRRSAHDLPHARAPPGTTYVQGSPDPGRHPPRRNGCPARHLSASDHSSGNGSGRSDSAQSRLEYTPPKIKHVWNIILENKSYEASFTGLNNNSYLWKTLPTYRELQRQYSWLRSMEDVFGIGKGGSDGAGHLGYAGAAGLRPFGPDGNNNPRGRALPPQPSGEGGTYAAEASLRQADRPVSYAPVNGAP